MKTTALKILANTKLFYLLLILIIIIQVLSLDIFMQPWYDEVVLADISRSVATNNHYLLNILPLSTADKEVFFYGPVFFAMQAFIIKHVAFSSFLFRFTVYCGGVASAFILGRIIFLVTNKLIYERIFLLLFFSNYLICCSLSCGRMEMMALLFISSALYFFLKIYFKKSSAVLLNTIFSGVFFGLSILTTPRSSFLYLLFVTPLFEIFIEGVHKRNFKLTSVPVIHVVMSFLVPYFIWYYPHFGNPYELFNYITPAAKTQFSLNNNRIDVNSFTWLMVDAMLFIVAFIEKVKLFRYLYGFFLCALIFIAVVIPWSYHHGIIVPVLILIAVLSVFFIRQNITKFFTSNLLFVIFWVQFVIISAKYSIIWIDLPERNSDALQQTIEKYIPPQAKVAGNYNYYYACINNNCDFRSIGDATDIKTGKPVPVSVKAEYLINIYRAEYLVIQDNQKILQPFIENYKYVKIASIKIPKDHQTFWQKNREKFGLPAGSFYNGSIYKRVAL